MGTVFFLIACVLIRLFWSKLKPEIHWISPVLALALPFSAGGFHISVTAVLSLFLAIALLEQVRIHGCFHFTANVTSISVLLLFTAYCITPFWAADKGMAGFALPKYLPLVLYLLFLMQMPDDIPNQVLHLIPPCGCLMTIVSLCASCLPGLQHHVTVNGRLAGLFQYPNSFAAFLLAGLIIQLFSLRHKSDFAKSVLLVTGIILSGSKTVFVLMILFMAALVLMKRRLPLVLFLGTALLCGLGAGLLAQMTGLLSNADRFTDIHATSGTFLVRLLYFRDAIPAILSNPFGIGYMGYPAIEGAIQTGRYYVSYIHNEFLQLLLEAGWIPAMAIAFSLLSALLSRQIPPMFRLILLAVLTHCMLDFDLQFCIFWIILLSCTDVHRGRPFSITPHRFLRFGIVFLTAAGLWLGCGDWLYRAEKPALCLYITPFHTEALTYQMAVSTTPQQMDSLADQILSNNPTHSLAHSAKAMVAFHEGDAAAMIQHKEAAIQSSRYSTAEYCDYFEKLYTAMQGYLQSGDTGSAAYCRKKLLEIPEMMETVSRQTHPLASMTGDDSSLMLPPEYVLILRQLQ